MNIWVILLAVVGLALSARGQGQFYFNNRIGSEVKARIYATYAELNAGVSSVGSPGWEVQLFNWPTGNQLIPLEPSSTGFRGAAGTALAGYVNPVTVTVPGVPPGGQASVVLRFLGPNSFQRDVGRYLVSELGGGPIPPPNLQLGTSPIVLQDLPEPSTWVLVLSGVGAISLWFTVGRRHLALHKSDVPGRRSSQ